MRTKFLDGPIQGEERDLPDLLATRHRYQVPVLDSRAAWALGGLPPEVGPTLYRVAVYERSFVNEVGTYAEMKCIDDGRPKCRHQGSVEKLLSAALAQKDASLFDITACIVCLTTVSFTVRATAKY